MTAASWALAVTAVVLLTTVTTDARVSDGRSLDHYRHRESLPLSSRDFRRPWQQREGVHRAEHLGPGRNGNQPRTALSHHPRLKHGDHSFTLRALQQRWADRRMTMDARMGNHRFRSRTNRDRIRASLLKRPSLIQHRGRVSENALKTFSSGFNISFTDRDKALEIFEEGNLHLTTGGSSACARPDHLRYNFSLPDCGGCHGLRVKMDNINATCSRSATISTGHLTSKIYYNYGDFEVYGRSAHSVNGSRPPRNAFTCFSAYTYGRDADGVHNEIALCWPPDDTTVLHMGHWDGKDGDHEHLTVQALGFDASAAYHRYRIQWRRDSITYFIDGKTVHTVQGGAIPFENLSMRIILRPNNKPSTYEGEALFTVRYASYTPADLLEAQRGEEDTANYLEL